MEIAVSLLAYILRAWTDFFKKDACDKRGKSFKIYMLGQRDALVALYLYSQTLYTVVRRNYFNIYLILQLLILSSSRLLKI